MEISTDRNQSEKEALAELRSLLKGKNAGHAKMPNYGIARPPTQQATLDFKTKQNIHAYFPFYSRVEL